MLEPEQWDSALSNITGALVRGTERISSNAVLNLLDVGPDPVLRQRMAKRVASHMRRLQWSGPRGMRIPGTTGTVQGYWRRPGQLPRPPAGMPVAGEFCDDVGQSDDLPAALEQVTRQGLKKLSQVLRAPLDITDSNLTRSQVTAAGIAVNAQLRADEHQLRRKAQGDTLARLIKLIEEEMPKISKAYKRYQSDVPLAEVQQAEHVEVDPSDVSVEEG
jgi:hypothetical protein